MVSSMVSPIHLQLQTQLGHLRDAYSKTLTVLGAAPAAASAAAGGALLEPVAPEVGGDLVEKIETFGSKLSKHISDINYLILSDHIISYLISLI